MAEDTPPPEETPQPKSTDPAAPVDERRPFRERLSRRLLAVDAFIDTAVYRAGTGLVEGYRRLSMAMRLFRVRGPKRLFVEILDDGLTIGAVGFVLMMTLALPAM